MNDVLLAKAETIQRCVRRARDIYGRAGTGFAADLDAQDAAILNILRACETAIDLANHIVRKKRLGIPKSSADGFRLLTWDGILSSELAHNLARMVGFRNIAVHEYREIDLDIVKSIIAKDLDDLVTFSRLALTGLG